MSGEVTELARLRALNEQLRQLHEVLKERVALLEQENKLLKEKIDLLIRRIFGAKSEKLDAAQLELLLSGLEPAKSPASEDQVSPEAAPIIELVKANTKSSTKNDGQRERWPSDLPIQQQIVEPEEVKANPSAFAALAKRSVNSSIISLRSSSDARSFDENTSLLNNWSGHRLLRRCQLACRNAALPLRGY